MTVNQKQVAGATSHTQVDWHAINWQQVHQNVRRLQVRIVKAAQAGRWGKVKALQHLLTHSFSGKALAIKRVTENQGKRTPGVDGETWSTPARKTKAIGQLRQRGYKPQPLRRIYIAKKNGKLRPLSIPTMKDRGMQALYLLALDPIAETLADPNSYGFRQQRSTADAIEQCFTVLSKRRSPQWVLEGDIQSCFDEISHDWLEANVVMDTTILHKWLKAGFIDRGTFGQTIAGTPQGGICSPVLANLTLDGLEKEFQKKFPKPKTGYNAKVNLIRYCDDFLITGISRPVLETEVKPLVEQFLRSRGLKLSPEKTKITHISDGFDFLGQNLRKYNGKLIIKPSRPSIKAFLTKIRGLLKAHKSTPAGRLIGILNPIIRGWANYHCHVVSKVTFAKVSHAIFQALWRWAKRRHPNKPRQWIKHKYFKSIGGQNWVFCGETVKDGQTQQHRLLQIASVPIRRHRKIRGKANPYDPEWEQYFEKRLGVKMANDLKGKRTLLYLWQEQDGICPVCHQKITKLTGWHSHHIVWRTHGGTDGASNRVLLHPNCHRQVHSLGLTVAKPRPTKRSNRRLKGLSCMTEK